MNYPSDKRKKSISFHADTWDKIARRKNLSGFINDLIRKHFDEKGDHKSSAAAEEIIQELVKKNQEQEKIIQDYLAGWTKKGYYDYQVGYKVSKELISWEELTSWRKRTSE